MTENWISYPVPEVPVDMLETFVAHSVVATPDPSLMTAPSMSWVELSELAKSKSALNPKADELDSKESDTLDESISEKFIEDFRNVSMLCANIWDAPGNSTIVALRGGTIILASENCECFPKFNGFISLNTPKGTFSHRMPPHRFKNKESDAIKQMISAQKRYEEYTTDYPDEKKYVDMAYVTMNAIGYPNEGMDDANADVVALWFRESDIVPDVNTWAALVELKCFNRIPIGVIVLFDMAVDKRPNSLEWMKQIADAGRNMFREEFLYPQVLGCFPVARK